MWITLPLAKFAFQYTQEVPAQITKYCQLMNRLCTASEAVNLSQLLLVKKKKKNLKTLLFPFIQNKNMFSSFKGQILHSLPNSWHGNSLENNSYSQRMATFGRLPFHNEAFCALVADLHRDLHPQLCPRPPRALPQSRPLPQSHHPGFPRRIQIPTPQTSSLV